MNPTLKRFTLTYGATSVDLLHDGLGAVDEAVFGGVVALEVLLRPAVALAPRRTVLADQPVRLAAVFHLGKVPGEVVLASDVRNLDVINDGYYE